MHVSTHYQKKKDECTFAQKQEKNSVSLDKTLKNGFSIGSMVQASGLTPEEIAVRKEEWGLLEDTIYEVLDDREQHIVKESSKWFGHKTLEDLGYDFGISRQRVHQIEQSVFAKLHRRLSQVGGII
jgi:DNA-directed RNA polymerase sigma subunit (sigma70/sigma32)